MTTRTTEPYACGVSWVGHFPSRNAAERAIGKVEQHLMLECGYEEVRGGTQQQEKALCGCDTKDDCDGRVGCLFVPFDEED